MSSVPSLWSWQTGFYVQKIENNNGIAIGTYIQKHFKSGSTDGTNVLHELEVSGTLIPWIPSATDQSFEVIWCTVDDVAGNNDVFNDQKT